MTKRKSFMGAISLLLIVPSYAQVTSPEERAVIATDSAFWISYNACDVGGMQRFLTEDLEFYHDKGGIQKGIESFVATTRKNLCANNNFRLRREEVPGTRQVHLLHDNGKLYGAIISGQHMFYIVRDGKSPRPDGLARYTHLLLLTDGSWKMSRILSYDHGPAPYVNRRTEVKLSKKELESRTGTYLAPNAGTCRVTRSGNLLVLGIGDKQYYLHPESRSLFFQVDRDLTFEFTGDKLIVREFGDVVEEAVRKGKPL